MTSPKTLGSLDEPGLKEIRPGVWSLRAFAGRRPNGSPIQSRKTVDSGTGRIGAGVREARATLAQMRTDIESSRSKKGKVATGYTVAQLLDRYVSHCAAQDRSPTTIAEYERIARKVIGPELGDIKVADIDQDDIDAFYGKLRARGLSAMTVKHVHALLHASLKFGMKKRLVRHNPATLASPPPVRRREVEAPSVPDVRSLIARTEERDPSLATFVILAALTGARRGELCGLRWSDLDTKKSMLTIERTAYTKPDGSVDLKPPKTHQTRRVGLDQVALEALRRHRERVEQLAGELELRIPADAFIFSDSPTGSEPLRPDLVTGRFRRAARAASVETHLHALRHFQASQGMAAGFDAVTVAERLGHSDPSVTLRIYSHAVQGRDQGLPSAMGELLVG